MTTQRKVLDYLITKCCDVDPECEIQLQGSVARGEEREDSDVTVVLTDIESPVFNTLINERNHGQMIRVIVPQVEVPFDINWVYGSDLIKTIKEHGAIDWYMYYEGENIHDPVGIAGRCHAVILEWFKARREVKQAWDVQ